MALPRRTEAAFVAPDTPDQLTASRPGARSALVLPPRPPGRLRLPNAEVFASAERCGQVAAGPATGSLQGDKVADWSRTFPDPVTREEVEMCERVCVVKLALVLVAVVSLMAPGRASAEDQCVVLHGKEGPGKGKHVVLIAADDEYRSEELIPQLAKVLAAHHGFRCTVLFAINPEDGTITPNYQKNIPGLEALATADLLVMLARFRELPDEQMKHIVDYTNSGKPIIGLRTATHAFRYGKESVSPYANLSWDSTTNPEGGWGRAVLGETWVSHHGHHNHESTRGVVADGMADHPILKGVEDIWGPSDVYTIRSLTGDSQPLVMGQVLTGMSPTDPPNPDKALLPVAWTKSYTGDTGKTCRVFTTTMGHAGDFQSEGFRRLMVNGCYWALGMEAAIPAKSEVSLVGKYEPNDIGVGGHKPGLRPSDHRLSL